MKKSKFINDIFVSYASADDQTLLADNQGWVTTFIDGFRKLLTQQLGRPDMFTIWMDTSSLRGNSRLSEEIVYQVKNSGIFLMILSPAYLASEWCQEELKAFIDHQPNITQNSNIFIVEKFQLESTQNKPTSISDILGYRFWYLDEHQIPRTYAVPAPRLDEQNYFLRIGDMARDMAGFLKPTNLMHGININESSKTVFLAETTDDLENHRDDIKRYLQAAGLMILPQTSYSLGGEQFKQSLTEDIEKADLFVQILSASEGKKPPDLPQGYIGIQYEVAFSANLPILQWCSPDLDIENIQTTEYKSFLSLETVFSLPFETFKKRVVTEVHKPPKIIESKKTSKSLPCIFINAERDDREIVEKIHKDFKSQALVAKPIFDGSARILREDLEQNLSECDICIIIYEKVDILWVHRQLWKFKSIRYKRKNPLSALVIYDGPPEQKAEISISLPEMEILNCRGEQDYQKLIQLIQNKIIVGGMQNEQ